MFLPAALAARAELRPEARAVTDDDQLREGLQYFFKPGQTFFIHHAVAGAVDEYCSVFHFSNELRVHHVVGGGAARNVQGNNVALGENIFNAGRGDADVQSALACQKVIVAQQNGFKSLQTLDEVAADVA